MSELGGMEGFSPEDGVSGAPEELSEAAKARFAANAAAIQQVRKEEKQSKKRDDKVAQIIVQFLTDEKHAHLFLLISRLVGRNCPSIFILAILSLIHQASYEEVQTYIEERMQTSEKEAVEGNMPVLQNTELDEATNRSIIEWVTRMQMVLSIDANAILLRLLLDEKNIDGSVLQLATFTLQEFFIKQEKTVPFEKVQPITANILQSVFEPFMANARKKLLDMQQKNTEKE